jgi:hypothetical protein
MAKKKVFVSFDYDNDKRYKALLKAWDHVAPEFKSSSGLVFVLKSFTATSLFLCCLLFATS